MSIAPIRIIFVDDHKVIRESWKILLENSPRMQVVAVCENGETAIEHAERLLPDIMLVDINMSPLNGFDVTERVLKSAPSVRIIGLSVNNEPKHATRIMELGARGYITKTSPLDEIKHGIMEVYNGRTYICDEIKRNMPDKL